MTTTPPQQYCLRWNNYQNNLTNVFDQLLQNGSFVDVTLACDGHSLKAHKMVLSACSPYFQTLFFENPCKHPIVILKDVRWEELKAVVEFMYRGEINVSQEQLSPLLKVAESLKIRGLADVSRGSSADFVAAAATSGTPLKSTSTGILPTLPGRHLESDGEGPLRHHRHPFQTPPTNGNGFGRPRSSLRRKRRRLSDERSLSPADTLDDHSNQLEIDSNHGDFADGSPLGPRSPTPGIHPRSGSGPSVNPSPGILPIPHGPPSSNSLSSITSHSLLSLHNAAAAAAAAVAGSSSTVTNEMDLKPGIVEMIREEERAKMLESSHGWLGPSVASTISDSYQYQIQSLWQKCWNTNQSGMHALRFRERGPLKSWRPETMAEAIFAVLREGLSLSQAARKFDIPYPTFVLYANRVHNMLGPSADGSGGNDLLSDMRPKGRGRPQRILLGSWPEDHIRGVIRAVVFRDNGKEDLPFVFNRDPGLLGASQGATSHNGLDMSLHPQFGGINPFLSLQQSHSNSTSTSASPNGNINGSNPISGGHGALLPNVLNDPGSNAQVEIGHSSSSNSPLDGLSCKGMSGLSDHHAASSRLLLSSTRRQDRDTSALMLMGLGLKSKFVNENAGPAEMLQIKAELPFEDDDLDEGRSDEEDEEDQRRRGKIQINIEKNLESNNSSISSVQNTMQSAPTTPRRPSQQENDSREVNTPSPQFQQS